MQTYPIGPRAVVRKPSAFGPLIMSFLALSVVVLAIATGKAKPQADEGAVAHVWQLLMLGQLPLLGWFALHWLRHDLKSGLFILALQIIAFGTALMPVWLLGL